LKGGIRERAHDALRAVGFDVVRFRPQSHWLARRKSLIDHFGVDLVLDVGANDGEFGTSMRRIGYRGRMTSFEPLPDAYQRLAETRKGDQLWSAYELALGDVNDEMLINIAGNSASSSLLPMLPVHEQLAPGTANTGTVSIKVRTFDSIADAVLGQARRPYLKIDTQGYEKHVLDGASGSLDRFVGMQVEVSVRPLYAGAPGLLELLEYVENRGFVLMSVEPGFSHPKTGQLLQFGVIAFRPVL
jgi:FkbM family methyltransferase